MLGSRSKRKAISLWLAIIFVFQSCTVYKQQLSNFDRAIAKNAKVKAIKSNGETYIIKNMEKTDGVYYADVNSGKGFKRLIISSDDFAEIQMEDKRASIALNILVPIIVLSLLFIGAASASYGF